MSDVSKLFSLGVEKVILNSCLSKDLRLIKDAATVFGSQSIVVSLDIKKVLWAGKKAFFKKGTEKFAGSYIELAKNAEAAGAGELIIHAIDRDGTLEGYDLELIKEISSVLSIPTISCGGLSDYNDMVQACKNGASAIAGGSYFVYMNKNPQSILISYPSQEELISKFYSQINNAN